MVREGVNIECSSDDCVDFSKGLEFVIQSSKTQKLFLMFGTKKKIGIVQVDLTWCVFLL